PSPESVVHTWLDRSHIISNKCIDAGIVQGSVLTLLAPGSDHPHNLPLILTAVATGQGEHGVKSSLYYFTDRIARTTFHKAKNEWTEYWARAHCPRRNQSAKLSSCMM
ncbi:hypothetical protein GB937_005599, partial [Aspergillus fischeri]